ncbi:hypothetical protein D3C76_481660 [compost metagenome]
MQQFQLDTGLGEFSGLVQKSACGRVQVVGRAGGSHQLKHSCLATDACPRGKGAGSDDRGVEPDQRTACPQNPEVEVGDAGCRLLQQLRQPRQHLLHIRSFAVGVLELFKHLRVVKALADPFVMNGQRVAAFLQGDAEPLRLAIEQVAVALDPAVLDELGGVVADEQVRRTQQLVVAQIRQEVGLHEHDPLALRLARARGGHQHVW